MPNRKKVGGATLKRAAQSKRVRKPRRGPRRWLDDDLLILYDRSSGGVGDGITIWRDAFTEFKRRQRMAPQSAALPPGLGLGAPVVPGATNWLPIGPTVVMDGQTGGGERQPDGLRAARLVRPVT
ncbi:MAG TPA: hypothetical protein VK148_17770 [Xanthobacteraceae bacterium]|nr:hypothetical protein [Xanthobacteraceae bacterium]